MGVIAPDILDPTRFERAVESIDAANAADPNFLVVDGMERPKELTHAEMATEWVLRLRPDASEALLLAVRAHHVRRWEIPRSSYPEGRAGYLRWKRDLQRHHADIVGELLAGAGYDDATAARVQAIVRKEGLRARDPEVVTFEDALCLTFLQTQLASLAEQLDDAQLIDALAKSLAKMSPAGRAAAAELSYGHREQELIARAVAANAGSSAE